MEETPNNGTSINNLYPSDLSTTTNHGTSRVQVSPTICKSGAQTQDGGNSSSIPDPIPVLSLTSEITTEY